MDIVEFWSQQVELWRKDQKCGLCWDFGAPLYESAVESHRIKEGKECCVQVLLINPSFSSTRNYLISGLYNTQICTDSFQLLFVMPSRIDINNFNELPGFSIEESKWFTVFNRLKKCIECDAELAFCEILGSNSLRLTNWSATILPANFTSNNYAGFRLNVSFQRIT